jgi:hypothetical protein
MDLMVNIIIVVFCLPLGLLCLGALAKSKH